MDPNEVTEALILSPQEFEKMNSGKQMHEWDIRTMLKFPYTDVRAVQDGTDLRFKCGVKGFSRLCKSNGVPLAAKSLSYFFSGIQWRAGRGWPIYATRCPILQVNPNDPFPGAVHHSLVVVFGGGFWPECDNSNVGVSSTTTDIFVGPNDDQYPDNTGEFTFVIAGLSA